MKNKKDINKTFEQILLGRHPKDGIVLNLAYATYEMLREQGYDENTILKGIIIIYHDYTTNQLREQILAIRRSTKPFFVVENHGNKS